MFATSWTCWAGLNLLVGFQSLHAGVACVDITPPVGLPMWGYASRHAQPAQGIADRLFARVVILARRNEKLALVSLDLGRPPTRQMHTRIRAAMRTLGIDHGLLVASHTHHGPVLELANTLSLTGDYLRQMEAKLIATLRKANASLQAAQLKVASRRVQANRNRVFRTADPPLDQEMTVLAVQTLRGQPLATLVHYTGHPTLQGQEDLRWSADYVGALCAHVQSKTQAPCLFLQGAAGDVSVVRSRPTVAATGIALAEQALQILQLARSVPVRQVRAVRRTFQFQSRMDIGNVFSRTLLEQAFFPELIAFYEREYREGVRPETTVAYLSDQLALVGYSGEPFCSHALALKRRAGIRYLLVMGYCNDYQQYFPTIEASAVGGYGTKPPVALAELGAGERMTNSALLDLFTLRGRFPERKD